VATCPFGDRGGRLLHALRDGAYVYEGKTPLLAGFGLRQSADCENQFDEVQTNLLG
jgi:hypothetical protein